MTYRTFRPEKVAGTFPVKVPATFWLRVNAFLLVLMAAGTTVRAADSVLYRLFLNDGTSIVSYGEFARVAGRVVLSIPLGDPSQSPALQLISIPETSVDWLRTDRYSDAVRAKRYGETRGENDFALLSARVTEALNQITMTSDPARRLAMAVEARGNLARWPHENFGYRAVDVGQLVGMLDEVISELRVAAGQSSFDVSLVANVTASPPEDLLPAPSFRETMEQAVAAAAATPEAAERISLLDAVSTALQEPAKAGGWAAALRLRASTDLAGELRINKAYSDSRPQRSQWRRPARRAGTFPVSRRSVQSILKADDRLGRRRPQETSALLQLLDLRLDEARRVRLARDAWIVRQDSFKAYRAAIAPAIAEFRASSASSKTSSNSPVRSRDCCRTSSRGSSWLGSNSPRSHRPRICSRCTRCSRRPFRWPSGRRLRAGTRYHQDRCRSRGRPRRQRPARCCCFRTQAKNSIG